MCVCCCCCCCCCVVGVIDVCDAHVVVFTVRVVEVMGVVVFFLSVVVC